MPKYTLVQHSAFGYKRDMRFRAAVEEAAVSPAEAQKIEKAGGLLFDNYTDAYDAAYKTNYPENSNGMIPKAPGKFHSRLGVRGLLVYLPPGTKIGKEKMK